MIASSTPAVLKSTTGRSAALPKGFRSLSTAPAIDVLQIEQEGNVDYQVTMRPHSGVRIDICRARLTLSNWNRRQAIWVRWNGDRMLVTYHDGAVNFRGVLATLEAPNRVEWFEDAFRARLSARLGVDVEFNGWNEVEGIYTLQIPIDIDIDIDGGCTFAAGDLLMALEEEGGFEFVEAGGVQESMALMLEESGIDATRAFRL